MHQSKIIINMKRTFLILMTSVLFLLSMSSCDTDDDQLMLPNITTPAELTTALNELYQESQAPGFAVSIVTDGTILYQQSFGKADIQNDKDYTNQTTQPIGSISKTFVAAAIVKAVEQGHFTMETDINDILPITLVNPKQPNAIIRVKHLVTHTSGLLDDPAAYFQAYHILPNENMTTNGAQILSNEFGFQQRESIPLEEFLAEYYLPDGDLYNETNFATTAPGTVWNYSNIATSLAAYLVEISSGISFSEYVQMHILDPLGMEHTAYSVSDLQTERLAKLYWEKDTPFPLYANDSYPDGSLYSNNEDMSYYLMDMLKGVMGESTTLFSEEGYDLLFETLLSEGQLPSAFGDNQSIFWFFDGDQIKHDGSDPGNTCNLQFDQDGTSGYILLTNMDASTSAHTAAYFDLSEKVDQVIKEFLEHN